MAALPVIVAISNILGIQTMLVFNMKKTFSRIVLFSGVLNLMLIVPLVSTVGAEGAALSVLVTEVVVTSLMAVALMKNGVLKQLLSKGSHL
jgi:O-antigen/teichoic acid export membrane protein